MLLISMLNFISSYGENVYYVSENKILRETFGPYRKKREGGGMRQLNQRVRQIVFMSSSHFIIEEWNRIELSKCWILLFYTLDFNEV